MSFLEKKIRTNCNEIHTIIEDSKSSRVPASKSANCNKNIREIVILLVVYSCLIY